MSADIPEPVLRSIQDLGAVPKQACVAAGEG